MPMDTSAERKEGGDLSGEGKSEPEEQEWGEEEEWTEEEEEELAEEEEW